MGFSTSAGLAARHAAIFRVEEERVAPKEGSKLEANEEQREMSPHALAEEEGEAILFRPIAMTPKAAKAKRLEIGTEVSSRPAIKRKLDLSAEIERVHAIRAAPRCYSALE